MTTKEYESRLEELEKRIKNLLPCTDNPVYLDEVNELERERRKLTREMADHSERLQMVKCMEYIARMVNDESVFELWLLGGVADGDIENWYDPTVYEEDEEALDYYIKDERFSDLMRTFLHVMSRANESGGLYCGDVVSSQHHKKPRPFCVVSWLDVDLSNALEEFGLKATDENVSALRHGLRARDALEERQIEAGWDVIYSTIRNLFREELDDEPDA